MKQEPFFDPLWEPPKFDEPVEVKLPFLFWVIMGVILVSLLH